MINMYIVGAVKKNTSISWIELFPLKAYGIHPSPHHVIKTQEFNKENKSIGFFWNISQVGGDFS